jgi:23S rRNA pseudouridine2605 synthase
MHAHPVRLQKILARAGVASRRAAEELIAAGRVRVNGRVVRELGAKADPRADRVEVDGRRVVAEAPMYVVINKPRGVVSTMSDPEARPTVRALLAGVPARVFPVGRLDFATSGALLATNDGDFADALMHPRRAVPKTYVLKVKGTMREADVERWRRGVRLEDGMTLPAKVRVLREEGDKTWLELTITEGRNQQIRRMGEATGFVVMRLSRVAVAGITCEGLRPGAWRYLTEDELRLLRKTYGVPKRIVAPPPMPARERSKVRSHARPQAHASRYGLGAPGRRRFDEDEHGKDEGPPARGSSGGAPWRTRTTGTSGGIGAESGSDYRTRRRR